MSIPGLESARRRRASHGRSGSSASASSSSSSSASAFSNISRSLTKHSSIAIATAAPPATSSISCTSKLPIDDDNSLLSRAMAARHRLDQKLSNQQLNISSRRNVARPHHNGSSSTAANVGHARMVVANQALPSPNGFTLREERSLFSKLGGQDECPVCLETFLSGQMVICLPCHHRFHRDCLLPWIQTHRHCPFCRAKIAH